MGLARTDASKKAFGLAAGWLTRPLILPAQVSRAPTVGPGVGPASTFYIGIPTGVHGPTCIVWVKLRPCSPQPRGDSYLFLALDPDTVPRGTKQYWSTGFKIALPAHWSFIDYRAADQVPPAASPPRRAPEWRGAAQRGADCRARCTRRHSAPVWCS